MTAARFGLLLVSLRAKSTRWRIPNLSLVLERVRNPRIHRGPTYDSLIVTLATANRGDVNLWPGDP